MDVNASVIWGQMDQFFATLLHAQFVESQRARLKILDLANHPTKDGE
jgi:hypothetical protein